MDGDGYMDLDGRLDVRRLMLAIAAAVPERTDALRELREAEALARQRLPRAPRDEP